MNPDEKVAMLSFTLTRWQRAINAIVRLAIALACIISLAVVIVSGAVVSAVFEHGGMSAITAAFLLIIVAGLVIIIMVFILSCPIQWPLVHICSVLFSNRYFNTVIILSERQVLFGVDGIQFEMWPPSLPIRMVKGLLGTYIITNCHYAVIISEKVTEVEVRKQVPENPNPEDSTQNSDQD